MASMDLVIDETFVSRLLLGALSEHEQRVLAAALARSDPTFRTALSSILEPFEVLDSELVREYSAALDREPAGDERARREILGCERGVRSTGASATAAGSCRSSRAC